ncbi:MAG: hypothetical protein DMF62_03885 [Acidobacteria bacterium]|nr:MAG: hypothetical protein DMF62_03885 [Acidobacteriota bacterium]
MNREIETKTERIVDLLDKEDLGGVLLNAQHNFAWITGGASNGIDLSRENGAASIFVSRKGTRYLLANNIEMSRLLLEEIASNDFEPIEFAWQDEKTTPDLLVTKARDLSDGQIASDIAVQPSMRTIENVIAPLRFELTSDEIVRYKTLGTDAASAICNVIDSLKPGQSEVEVTAFIRKELQSKNISSVVTLVAADERISKYRHPVPTSKTWSKSLLLVTCAKRNGLIASLSRMVCSETAPSELKEKTEAAAFVNASLWNATREGVTGAELYRTAAVAYSKMGFANEINLHHQGGATGYKTREWVVHPGSAEIVKADQAFAWNPSITGTKVEETVIATDDGIDVITASIGRPAIEHEIDGKVYNSPGIIEL